MLCATNNYALGYRAESRKSRREFLERPRTKQLMRIKSEGVISNKNMKYSGPQLILMANNRGSDGGKSGMGGNNSGKRPMDPMTLKWAQITRFVKTLFITMRTNVVKFDPEPPFLSGVNSLDVLL